jgi:DinB family protein
MELKPTLVAIANDARGWLKAWAADFSETDARLPLSDGRTPNPLAWQLGHIACVEDEVAQLFSMEEVPAPLVPVGVRSVCASGSPPPDHATRYPSLRELWDLLDRTHARLLGVLESASGDAELDRPPRVANPYFRSLGQGVYEAALHENYHVGEIAAVRKALGKPRIG